MKIIQKIERNKNKKQLSISISVPQPCDDIWSGSKKVKSIKTITNYFDKNPGNQEHSHTIAILNLQLQISGF